MSREIKYPDNGYTEKWRKEIEESCKVHKGRISPNDKLYIDGMIEGFLKGISWIKDNNTPGGEKSFIEALLEKLNEGIKVELTLFPRDQMINHHKLQLKHYHGQSSVIHSRKEFVFTDEILAYSALGADDTFLRIVDECKIVLKRETDKSKEKLN